MSEPNDTSRIDRLETYLSDPRHIMSGPLEGDPTWAFGHSVGDDYQIDGQGENLREAIDSLPNPTQPKP